MIDPITLWRRLHDPDDINRERAIRADQRRLDLRDMQATASTLRFLIEQLDLDAFAEKDRATLEKIHRVARQLHTHIERRAAA